MQDQLATRPAPIGLKGAGQPGRRGGKARWRNPKTVEWLTRILSRPPYKRSAFLPNRHKATLIFSAVGRYKRLTAQVTPVCVCA